MRSVALGLAAIVLCASSVRAQNPASSDVTKMNGIWDVVDNINRGERLSEPKQITIENGVIKLGDGQLTFTLTVDADPKQIDLRIPNRTQYYRGIYEIDGNTLRISHGPLDVGLDNPDGRPRSFNTDNNYYSHLRLQRASP